VRAAEDGLGRVRRGHALQEPAREVVYLRTYGSLSFKEIGAVLGKTENWARVTFYRAKEQLRKDVEIDAGSEL
jgi:RNA polymerase sigma-70 factor (ECF subfamily)